MQLRQEVPGDEAAIRRVTEAAFKETRHSNQTEAAIVAALRQAGALTLSVVATATDHLVVGHAAFSPVTINGEHQGWYGLGPVSVMPAHQRQGIGSALIHNGLVRLRALAAQGCVVLGDPAYYSRFGFRPDERLTYPNVPAAYFQILHFTGRTPVGEVAYHAGFNAQ